MESKKLMLVVMILGARAFLNSLPLEIPIEVFLGFLCRSQGITYVHFNMVPCGVNLPHTHPRASELLTMISGGPLQVGFVDTADKWWCSLDDPGQVRCKCAQRRAGRDPEAQGQYAAIYAPARVGPTRRSRPIPIHCEISRGRELFAISCYEMLRGMFAIDPVVFVAAINTTILGITSQGLTYVQFHVVPCGVNVPHTHPRETSGGALLMIPNRSTATALNVELDMIRELKANMLPYTPQLELAPPMDNQGQVCEAMQLLGTKISGQLTLLVKECCQRSQKLISLPHHEETKTSPKTSRENRTDIPLCGSQSFKGADFNSEPSNRERSRDLNWNQHHRNLQSLAAAKTSTGTDFYTRRGHCKSAKEKEMSPYHWQMTTCSPPAAKLASGNSLESFGGSVAMSFQNVDTLYVQGEMVPL
ncbi:hypothetical protein SELMODRAFT_402991 [Selaginella moellendorffii]|uniref:Cupin type-1 domain-containing protein n=1 Tax=Selaginella moellendorffii TaxID=88036 RepID=D8QNQ0_SELML|nr:hypothetical protein SELMODRAFT_402991 [Selaginella moellendorffii]